MYQHKAVKTGIRTFLIGLVAVVGVSLVLTACGGGRNASVGEQPPGQEVDIDKLLGTEDTATSPAATNDENEVLRLLGLAPDSSTTGMSKSLAGTDAAVSPEPELDKLQREVTEKDQMIAALQSDVSEKDRKIQQLQVDLERAQRNGARPLGNDYASRYAHGRDLYEQRQYRDAIKVFSDLLVENDKNSLADNSQYWIGESYYGLGNFAQAIAEFEKIFTFPRSDKNDDAQLKIGLCYLRMGDTQQAKNGLEQLLATYPNSEYAGKARRYLSRL
ncbi:MAG: tetratricopeptide repeat protein [bacterium]